MGLGQRGGTACAAATAACRRTPLPGRCAASLRSLLPRPWPGQCLSGLSGSASATGRQRRASHLGTGTTCIAARPSPRLRAAVLSYAVTERTQYAVGTGKAAEQLAVGLYPRRAFHAAFGHRRVVQRRHAGIRSNEHAEPRSQRGAAPGKARRTRARRPRTGKRFPGQPAARGGAGRAKN